jgi:NAD(P)-dependent dehydrogenase (short-subunit alcohol dehydrogenase family)
MQAERRFQPLQQYSLTKLYNILFTRELDRREVAASCVSPGFLRTDLGRDARRFFRAFLTVARPFQQSPDKGAENVLRVLDARADGAYFRGMKQVAPSTLAQDDAAAARLWELSCALSRL